MLLSAGVPKLAAGATIVLMGTAAFTVSVLFGRRRGVFWRWQADWQTRQRVGLDDLLRAVYEVIEPKLEPADGNLTLWPVSLPDLMSARRWTTFRVRALLQLALSRGLLRRDAQDRFHLTAAGRREAQRAVRNHRLWELYLIHYAAVAPSHVDRSADAIEHVLQPEIVDELEELLRESSRTVVIPQSPHPA